MVARSSELTRYEPAGDAAPWTAAAARLDR
jgi:hypothetical protein